MCLIFLVVFSLERFDFDAIYFIFCCNNPLFCLPCCDNKTNTERCSRGRGIEREMENGVEKRQRVMAAMFSDEEVGDISGVKIGDDYVEVTCGCTSHRYGDAVGRLRVFSTGELEITCECTPGCQEGLYFLFLYRSFYHLCLFFSNGLALECMFHVFLCSDFILGPVFIFFLGFLLPFQSQCFV